MKDIIIQLIQDDIRITRLIRTLAKLEIDASAYTPNKTSVVLKLLKQDYEANADEYLKLIEIAADTNNDIKLVEWLENQPIPNLN